MKASAAAWVKWAFTYTHCSSHPVTVCLQLAEHVPLIRLVGLHELARRPILHFFIELAFLVPGQTSPVILNRVSIRLAAIPIHHALFGVIHVQPAHDSARLDNKDSVSCAMIVDTLTLAVVAQALHEVGPSSGSEGMPGR